ncbi:MAG: helix-turn-helix transcriptional regulator [Terriglobales bacterium]
MSDRDTLRAIFRYKTETALRDLERQKELEHERKLAEIRASGFPPTPVIPPPETIADQLERLRGECNWTHERLAEAVNLDVSSVTRHLAGNATPQLGNIARYEHAFSKHLKRQVLIKKTPRKRG